MDNGKQKISIVITYLPVSDNIDRITGKCLEKVEENTFNNKEIILVSNGKVREYLLSNLKVDLEIVELKRNYGNAYAWDRGIQATNNELVILMDNDVFVKKDWDKGMIETLSDDIAITFPYSILNTNDYRRKEYRGRIDGFCFALKKETYRKVGPFLKDQPFHSYYEDTAFFTEVQFNLNKKLKACPNSKVFHMGQSTTKKIMSAEIKDGVNANKEWFEKKYSKQYPYL